jgi:hypothetical protein
MPKINFAVYDPDPDPPLSVMAEIKTLTRFEVNIDYLKKRYGANQVVNREYTVKVIKRAVDVDIKAKNLMKKLEALAYDRAATKAESANAQRRMEELGKKETEVEVVKTKRVVVENRRDIFMKNIAILANNYCGLIWDDFFKKERLFVYAHNEKELNQWLDLAESFADVGRKLYKEEKDPPKRRKEKPKSIPRKLMGKSA